MKILHICTEDTKGAGLCAYRLHKTFLSLGYESKMLVLKKYHKDDKTVFAPYTIRFFFYRILHRFLRFFSIYLFEYDKVVKMYKDSHTLYSTPNGFIDITNNALVKEADIIHLHFVEFFIDQAAFLKKIKKPIVWTIHDEGFFYGISHYSNSIDLNNPLEVKYLKVKRDMVLGTYNLGVVLLSKYFMDNFGHNPMLNNCKKCIINNSVDCSKFIPLDRRKTRIKYNLSEELIYLIVVATDISDPRKGLGLLISAVEKIKDQKLRIIAVGDNSNFIPHPLVITTGKVYDDNKLSELYSAADIFIMPSLQEAFSQVPIEAMACGKPVVAFPVSGTEELITADNGYCCADFTIDSLVEGINYVMNHDYDCNTIRKDVLTRFSPVKIAQEYLTFYQQLFNNND